VLAKDGRTDRTYGQNDPYVQNCIFERWTQKSYTENVHTSVCHLNLPYDKDFLVWCKCCFHLRILPFCTEPWHDTSFISISWYFCKVSNAIWWINDVYIDIDFEYHTHSSTTFYLIKLTNFPFTCEEKTSVLKGLTIYTAKKVWL